MSRTTRTIPAWTKRWPITERTRGRHNRICRGYDVGNTALTCWPSSDSPKGYDSWTTASPSNKAWAKRGAAKITRRRARIEIEGQIEDHQEFMAFLMKELLEMTIFDLQTPYADEAPFPSYDYEYEQRLDREERNQYQQDLASHWDPSDDDDWMGQSDRGSLYTFDERWKQYVPDIPLLDPSSASFFEDFTKIL